MARAMNRASEGNLFKRVYLGFHSNAWWLAAEPSACGTIPRFSRTDPHQQRLAELAGAEVTTTLCGMTVPPLDSGPGSSARPYPGPATTTPSARSITGPSGMPSTPRSWRWPSTTAGTTPSCYATPGSAGHRRAMRLPGPARYTRRIPDGCSPSSGGPSRRATFAPPGRRRASPSRGTNPRRLAPGRSRAIGSPARRTDTALATRCVSRGNKTAVTLNPPAARQRCLFPGNGGERGW